MTTAALKAVAKGDASNSPLVSFKNFLERNKEQISAALPKHVGPDRMIRLALTEFSRNKVLQKCSPNSIFGSIIQASQLGLEIGVLGQAYLVPYYNKKSGQHEAQLIPGYKGLIALARRSGEVSSIETHVVYEKDDWELELGLQTKCVHRPFLDGDRGRPKLVYGVAHFKDGGHHFEWMLMSEVERIRGRSQSGNNGPWVTDYDQMVRKTVIRRMANYLPMSIELSNAIQLSDAADQGKRADIQGDIVVVHDEPGHDIDQITGGASGGGTGSGDDAPPGADASGGGSEPSGGGDSDGPGNGVTEEQIVGAMGRAQTLEALDLAIDLGTGLPKDVKARLAAQYQARRTELEGAK